MLTKLSSFVGATVLGSIGWWIGEHNGFGEATRPRGAEAHNVSGRYSGVSMLDLLKSIIPTGRSDRRI